MVTTNGTTTHRVTAGSSRPSPTNGGGRRQCQCCRSMRFKSILLSCLIPGVFLFAALPFLVLLAEDRHTRDGRAHREAAADAVVFLGSRARDAGKGDGGGTGTDGGGIGIGIGGTKTNADGDDAGVAVGTRGSPVPNDLVDAHLRNATSPALVAAAATSGDFDDEEDGGGEGFNLWSNSTVLPQWMKDYFDWHRRKRREERILRRSRRNQRDRDDNSTSAAVATETVEGTKYLLVLCLREFGKCGGTADRLKPVAFYVMYANQTKRVLLIKWTRPYPLEEFLVPPRGGIDWRVPPSVDAFLEQTRPHSANIAGTNAAGRNMNSDKVVLTAAVQTWDAGQIYFDEHSPEGYKFANVFGEMFRCMFTLSPPLAERVHTTMDHLGLVPGRYSTAHVRARYPTKRLQQKSTKEGWNPDKDGGLVFEGKAKRMTVDVGINAVNCAWRLGVPHGDDHVYFASDSHDLARYIVDDADSPFSRASGANGNGTAAVVKVSALVRDDEPLHLDTNRHEERLRMNGTVSASDFYPAFEDLWILGMGRCTSFGMGGYGRFGQMLSFNSSCAFNHRNYRGQINRCPAPSLGGTRVAPNR